MNDLKVYFQGFGMEYTDEAYEAFVFIFYKPESEKPHKKWNDIYKLVFIKCCLS